VQNYINLLRKIKETGVDRQDRTGIGSRFISGETLSWDLADGFPIITTRRVSFRIAFEETMFFLRGDTDTKKLEEKRINIWKGNTTREFLDSRGLQHLPEGSIGTGYSHQWRNFGGTVGQTDGVDQIVNLVEGIKKDPTGRRHIVSGWNPLQLDGTPLPPCHLMNMYTVDPVNNKLNSCFIMRSWDVQFGGPYNIMSYAFLNVALAKLLGYESGSLTAFGWDCHIYSNQLDMVSEQIEREPRPLPKIVIHKDLNTFDDLLDLQFEDVEIIGYDPHPDFKNKPPMAI
jgi:thymidylate synthase